MRGDEFFTQVLSGPPFSKMHPKIAVFFKDYLSNEKVIEFNGRFVLNTHFPPYPGGAFDNFAEHISEMGNATKRRLFSVTLAVTNRCNYRCWHCYNTRRSQQDMRLSVLKDTARQLKELGVVNVTLTGGEPLLRADLEEAAGAFGESVCLNLNTTGYCLTPQRARALRDSGIFGVGISLDSLNPAQHDRMRGREGAFQTALDALHSVADNGLYPYIIAVATHEFLQPEKFWKFIRFASEQGAREVHLLEPVAAGKLAGNTDVVLNEADKQFLLDYQKTIARDESLLILSCFLYLESSNAFGCGAGLTHLYIDGSGEVCPCNFIPLSFGNISDEPLIRILDRMGCHFCKPRTECVGQILSKHICEERLPLGPEASAEICREHLPAVHPLPRYFQIRAEAGEEVGSSELQSAYDRIHQDYDRFWLKEAAKPIADLAAKIPFTGLENVFEAGCGTGFATVMIAKKLKGSASITAVDLSEGMLAEARERTRLAGFNNVQFIAGDALKILNNRESLDMVFSSWVLGYIPLNPFFAAASRALRNSGILAFVVHKENSPREPLEIFGRIVAEDPSVLQKRVAFDFPRDINHTRRELLSTGFKISNLWDGKIIFRYNTAEEVLEHLLKSGAGTAYYDTIDPKRRDELQERFMETLDRKSHGTGYEVIHDYICCIATKLQGKKDKNVDKNNRGTYPIGDFQDRRIRHLDKTRHR